MILTGIEKETKALARVEGLTWEEIGRRCGMTRQGAYGIVHGTKRVIATTIVKTFEAMGYDIEIEYVRKNKE